MAEKRISLTRADFTALVSGEVIEAQGVKICLQDIGYALMLNILHEKTRTKSLQHNTMEVLKRTRNMLIDVCPLEMKGDKKLIELLNDIDKHI